jgi:hypothetical protein
MLETKTLTEEEFKERVGEVKRKGCGKYLDIINRALAGEFVRLDLDSKKEATHRNSALQLARKKAGAGEKVVIALRGNSVFVGPRKVAE